MAKAKRTCKLCTSNYRYLSINHNYEKMFVFTGS